MTVEIARARLGQSQGAKPVFTSVQDAKMALASDKLATVYRTAKSVYVVTAHGSGTFSKTEWDAE